MTSVVKEQEPALWHDDLGQLRQVLAEVEAQPLPPVGEVVVVNPTLRLLNLGWQGLADLSQGRGAAAAISPGDELVLVWRHAVSGRLCCRPANSKDLLALKLISEGLDLEETAKAQGVPVGQLDLALEHGEDHGLLLVPEPRLRRPDSFFSAAPELAADYQVTPAFTLQWHITQTCDLHCKHCYDRTARPDVTLDQAHAILDDFRRFCKQRHVYGQVTFTGGNPLLHPHFSKIYQGAAQRGLRTAILGNPASRAKVAELQEVQPLAFYQVSLEGLAEHNDEIRGAGHFQRVLAFLEVLRELKVRSMVMLTLTRANCDQVLPLAELLRDKVDYFTFNRLAMVGEGAALASAPVADFPEFLRAYRQAAASNPIMGLKDNFFNLQGIEDGDKLRGGCAGYGCGAAFNFVSLLPEGEVHACRKFPSPLGNILENSLAEIYDSPLAEKYRQGPEECQGCKVRPVCGGCLAVSHGLGQAVFSKRDPYCFL
ncbi:MAG: thio(seleno)oxazole modification radical SAM maturase SbtM [Thermodesulfobacteriota bacterium]